MPSEKLRRRLEAALGLEPGEAQIEEIRDVVRHAEAEEHHDLLVEARLAFIDARVEWANGPEDVTDLITAYSRCVSLYAAMPQRFAKHHVDNLWRGLGLVGQIMIEMADRPATQIRAVLDDMGARCRPERDDHFLVQFLRMKLEARRGDAPAAGAAIGQVRMLRLAEYVNPAVAVLMTIECLVDLGRDEDAIDAMDTLLSGQVADSDGADPRDSLDHVLMPYLRASRLDEARDAHRRTWRHDLDGFPLAAHLEFCARSGNEERGRDVLLRNVANLTSPLVAVKELRVAAAAALLCRRLIELGRGDETWIRPADDELSTEEEEYTYRRFHAELVEEATEFAAELDACNGTSFQSAWLKALIHADPIAEVPLSSVAAAQARIASRPTAASTPTVEATTTTAAPPTPQPTPTAASGPDQPLEPTVLLDLAERSHQLDDWPGLSEALRRYDAVVEHPVDELSRARRAELQAVVSDDREHRERLAREAAAIYASLGRPVRAQVCLGRLGQWFCLEGRGDEGAPLVEDAVRVLTTDGDPYQAAAAQIWLGNARQATGDPDGALAAFRAAEEALSGDDQLDPQRALVLVAATRIHLAQLLAGGFSEPRLTEAATAARAAAGAYRAAGHRHGLVNAVMAQGSIAGQAGEVDAAVRAYREAAGLAVGMSTGTDTDRAATSRAIAGNLLMSAGRVTEAIDELVEAVAEFTALGDRRAAFARVDLATAYRSLDRWLDAAEVVEEALPALDRMEDAQHEAMQARWMLAQSYEGLGAADDALRVLGEMLDRETDPGACGLLHKKVASILSSIDSDEEASAEYVAAAVAYAEADDAVEEADCRRLAAVTLAWAGLDDQALGLFDEVQRAVDRVPPESEAGIHARSAWLHDSAEILADAQRFDEAAERALAAADGFRDIQQEGWAGLGDLLAGRVLAQLGEREDAAAALRRAVASLPPDGQEHAVAIDLLAGLTAP